MDGTADRPAGGRAGLRAGAAWAATLVACLLLPAAAAAEVVTIGTPTAAFNAGQSSAGCNCTQYQATAPAGYVENAPANGVIIAWRVLGGGTLTLEAIRTAADGSRSIVGESGGGQSASSGSGVPAIPVHVPVLAGDSIGVHLSGSNPKVYNSGPLAGGTIGEAAPDIPASYPNLQTPGGTLDLNADVAITPVVTSVTPSSGPTGGTNQVTITGQYLDGATSVRFGTLAAAFTVISPTQITAFAPLQGPGPVDVTVTAQGAPSAITPADLFTYQPKPANAQQSSGGAGPPGTSVVNGASILLSPLSLSASYFLAAPSGASIARTATGTTLTYTVSAAATTTFVVQEVLAGRLLPPTSTGVRDCVAPNKATLPIKLPSCPRYVSLSPHLTHRGPAGRNVVHLTGRLAGRALAPGQYRLLASATSTATPTLVSASVTHAFHILKPPTPAKSTSKPKAHAALPTDNGSGATSAPA